MQNISETFSDMGWYNGRYKKHAQYSAPFPTGTSCCCGAERLFTFESYRQTILTQT